MTDDELYKKYLESLFIEQDGTYYYEPQTNKIFLDKEMVDRIVYRDLYHVFAMVNRWGAPDECIYGISGEPIYLKYPAHFEPISGLKGYYLMQIGMGGTTYNLYDCNDKLIFTYKENDNKHWPHVALEERNNMIVLRNSADDIVYKIPIIRTQKTHRVRKDNLEEIETILKRFNVDKTLREKMRLEDRLCEICYNDCFLQIIGRFSDGDELPICVICKSIKDGISRVLATNQAGLEVEFNNERCLIKDKNLTYYDNNGQVIKKFAASNYREWVNIDKTMANLIAAKKMHLKKEDDNLVGIVNGKKYKIYGKYYCERLLVSDGSNLYGYLDCQGEEVIKPQFAAAGTFENGIADTSEGKIDLDGNLLEDENLEKIKKNYSSDCLMLSYRGTFDINNHILGIVNDDFKCYLEIMPKKKGLLKRKPNTYYYVDYKTKSIVKSNYRPVRQYLNFVIFYIEKNFYWQEGYYLHDKNDGSYTWIASKKDEIYFHNDYFTLNGKTYYLTDQIIDLGDFYLAGRVKKDDSEIKAKEEFLKTANTIEKNNAKDNRKYLSDKVAKQQEYLLMLQEYQTKINEYEKKKIAVLKKMTSDASVKYKLEPPRDFMYVENGIRKISAKYSDYLRFYNLLMIDFADVDVRGLDFSGSSLALINPQTVYNKDMSNGNFCDVTFSTYDFNGVNTSNTVFNDEFVLASQDNILKKNLTK